MPRFRFTKQSCLSISLQFLLGVLLLIGASSSRAQTVTATVPVGPCPSALAVNPTTNTIYVASPNSENPSTACYGNNTVTVINGSTNTTDTIISDGSTTLLAPLAIAVNPTTDMVYVADDTSGDSVTLINGATNAASKIATSATAQGGIGVVVNPVTNTIYVLDIQDGGGLNGGVTVVNGGTGAVTATIPVGGSPEQIAINTVTNKIYVLNLNGPTVTVIDGATNDYSTISLAPSAIGVTENVSVSMVVNPTTNKIYVGGVVIALNTTTYSYTSQLLIIDGATNAVSTATVNSSATSPYSPEYVAVDAKTNMVYGTDPTHGYVMAYNAATGTATWITAGTKPTALAVDEGTDTIYVANEGSNDVTVINGATKGTTTVNVGNDPTGVAVNTSTHAAYALNLGDGTVSVINGSSTTVGQPTITSLSPSSATAGGAAFTLTINGTNFVSGVTANWGTTALTTTYVSATELTAAVPATLIATAGTASVTVTTSGGSSSAATFTINPGSTALPSAAFPRLRRRQAARRSH